MRAYVKKLRVAAVICISLVMGLASISYAQFKALPNDPLPGGQYNLSEYEKLTGEKIEKFSEAPDLRAKVAAGNILPVEERLPDNPAVVVPIEKIGQYGGTWRRCEPMPWIIDHGLPMDVTLVRWGPDPHPENIQPNVAEGWDFSKDCKSITFSLRKGIKWSDGHPLTTDDIMFYYDDVVLNDELTPTKPRWLMIGGELGKFEKLDAYTFRISFAKPYPLLPYVLSCERFLFYPKHYLVQFHPKYTSMETLKSLAKEEGFDNWYQLFKQKVKISKNPELPTLHAWILEKSWGPYPVTAKRNPYYWKVDPAGNQLPYIDELRIDYAPDWRACWRKVITGQVDMQGVGHRQVDYPLYMESREKGDFRVLTWPGTYPSMVALQLNQNCKEPVLRKIFRDSKFRKALSLAVNRKEIDDMVFLGLTSTIGQSTICSQSPLYREEFGKAYAEYDPDSANRMLDELGLKWDKKNEYRLRPDGKRLEITVSLRTTANNSVETAEVVARQYEKIGVKLINNVIQNELWGQRVTANEHEAVIIGGDTSPLLIDESPFIMTAWYEWGREWQKWYTTGGKSGEEPVEEVKRIFQLYDEYQITVDTEKRNRIGTEIFQIHAENVWIIGLGGRGTYYIFLVKNNFRNYPEEWLLSGSLFYHMRAHPEHWFFEQ